MVEVAFRKTKCNKSSKSYDTMLNLFDLPFQDAMSDLKEPESQNDDQFITPLWNFDYRKVDPIKYQAFITQGHVTMGKDVANV
jgi:hypothetical protein